MDIIDRLQEIIDYAGLNVSSFAKKIGVVDQTIRGIVVQRRNKPGFDILAKILQTFTWINAEWLITGKGEMIKQETTAKNREQPVINGINTIPAGERFENRKANRGKDGVENKI